VIVFCYSSIPQTVQYLILEQVNEPLDFANLPSRLTHLTTGKWFNQSVDNLPLTLTSKLENGLINQLINFHQHSLTSQLE
jgi:hypothetical protein